MVQSRVRPLHEKVVQTSARIVDVKEKIVTMEEKLKVTFLIRNVHIYICACA